MGGVTTIIMTVFTSQEMSRHTVLGLVDLGAQVNGNSPSLKEALNMWLPRASHCTDEHRI